MADPQDARSDRAQNPSMDQVQAEVNEMVGIMRAHVEKVLERDAKLAELDRRAGALLERGKRFEQQAHKLERKYWWKDLKMLLLLGFIALVLIIIIIVYFSTGGGDSSKKNSVATTSSPSS